ncbi:hypothetical protein ACFL0J_04560 [Candidatus Neomarinimicrobiota bacterium]
MQLIFKIITSAILFQNLIFGIGTQFLSIPQNAKELIIGLNPSIKNIINRPILSASYGNWLAGIKVSTFGYSRKALGGAAGFNVRYIALNDLELRTDRPTDDPLSVFDATAIALDGNYIRQTKIGLLSTKLRYISMQLLDEISTGFAMDIGLQHNINDKLNVGFTVLNLGSMSELNVEKPKLPVRMIVGSGYDFSFNEIDNSFFVALEKSSIIEGIILRVGEVTNWNKLQFLIGTQFSKDVASISGGIGIKLGTYDIKYGIQFGSQSLGSPQMLDLSVILP